MPKQIHKIMKEIKAFVRPKRLADIVSHLKNVGICCLTVFEGEGTGHYVDPEKEWPSLRHPFLHREIAKIEIVVASKDVDKVIKIIHEEGKTGSSGDGLIYITDVSQTVKVKDLSINHIQTDN